MYYRQQLAEIEELSEKNRKVTSELVSAIHNYR